MQKKLLYSGVTIALLGSVAFGVVQYNYNESSKKEIEKQNVVIKQQKEQFDKTKSNILEQKTAVESEKERLKKELEEQKGKVADTEKKLQEAVAVKKQKEEAQRALEEQELISAQSQQVAVTYSAPEQSQQVAVTYSAPEQSQQVAQPVGNSSAKEWIAQKESGGSYSATNQRYIGRYQLDSSYLGGDHSPENQERVADAYVAGRYGSWDAAQQFWLANGWY